MFKCYLSIYSYGLDKVVVLWDAVSLNVLKTVLVQQAVGGAVVIPAPTPPPGSDDCAVQLVLAGETGGFKWVDTVYCELWSQVG